MCYYYSQLLLMTYGLMWCVLAELEGLTRISDSLEVQYADPQSKCFSPALASTKSTRIEIN